MLTGRDSLNRLIGKRRRYLPNRESLLSAPIQSSLNLCNDTKNGKIIPDDETEKGYSKAARLVTCPICGSDVPGDNHMINSHLDACLARGTKRKLTQRTLLQLNFSAQTQDQNHSNETKLSTTNVFSEGPVESLEQNSICGLANYVAVEDYNSNHWRSTENTTSHQRINCDEKTPLSSPHINGPEHDVNVTVDGMSEATLQTFIVGRRYSDEKEIKIGAHISLSRDPNNVKDPNAVKGFVISAPKHSLDVAQIKITYHKIESDNENDDDIKVSTCLWKRALHVARSAKGYPSSMIKYQCNFNLLIQEVLGNSRHLFKADEIDFLESFSMLSGDSQRLFVRLYMRKGPWFRLSNISYPEVSNSREAVRELIDNGYIRSSEDTNELHDAIKDICNLLTVSELREISCVLPKNCHRGSRKQKVIASLLCFYEDGICPFLPKMILDRTGLCIRVSSKAEHLIWRAERLFFLNGEQDLSAFLLVDLGIVKYPTYNCIIAEQIFSGLCDLLAYEEAIELAQIMDQSLDENNIELVLRCIMIAESRMSSSSCKAVQSITSELANTFHLCFSASWVYSKVVLLGISFLEREQRFNDAINLLRRLLSCFTCDSRRGYWTLRLSIDLEHMGCPSESLSVAEGGLLDSWVRAGSRVALQRRVLRLGKPPRRWKIPSFSESIKRKITEIHVQGRPLNCEIGMKSWFYGEDGEKCGVEQLALQYYAREGGGWHGVHTESGIWLTIFGLLMWDILFSDVLDVFRSRFQNAPLDLATDSFYIVRKNLIESQLQKIYDGMAEEILITSWESHVGTVCRGVNWDRHSLSELRAAVTCIGGPCLAHLCRHLAQDYGSWSSGMPDLLIWRFHNEYRGEAKLVEVKGPRDRLSEQQRAWLLLLMDCGFKVEVCKVSAQPVST
ncbi:fanconi-associated nuclease 1 homolog isoform X2 [Citrus sinensis]|uniref:fanconi-associated nuclease 1 homolog isoform X2 n=1 Tax=Citrus sinensis TaxID=2711 RepID=UPI0022786667|nr:fanconi-associated nuclease 1 homolog isoform X2 [Citrus sinensis]